MCSNGIRKDDTQRVQRIEMRRLFGYVSRLLVRQTKKYVIIFQWYIYIYITFWNIYCLALKRHYGVREGKKFWAIMEICVSKKNQLKRNDWRNDLRKASNEKQIVDIEFENMKTTRRHVNHIRIIQIVVSRSAWLIWSYPTNVSI